jgi:hypothetical protein
LTRDTASECERERSGESQKATFALTFRKADVGWRYRRKQSLRGGRVIVGAKFTRINYISAHVLDEHSLELVHPALVFVRVKVIRNEEPPCKFLCCNWPNFRNELSYVQRACRP